MDNKPITREEQIIEAATSQEFIDGAKWADSHPVSKYKMLNVETDKLTGKDIIANIGGENMLKQFGFEYIEQGCNSRWRIKRTIHENVIDKYGYLEEGACTCELILTTYLYGYIGVSFYVYDNRYGAKGTQRIFYHLQVRTIDELKELVNIFNEYSV